MGDAGRRINSLVAVAVFPLSTCPATGALALIRPADSFSDKTVVKGAPVYI